MKKMKYITLLGFFMFLGMNSIHAEEMCANFGNDALPIPIGIPNFVSKLVILVQIMVPVIVVIMAMVRYFRAVTSGDDKVIKETNSSFIRSLITGVSIFLLIVIVKLVFSLAGDDATSSLKYVSCFLNGEEACDQIACPKRGGTEENELEYNCYKCNSEINSGNNTNRYIWHQGNPGTSYNNSACPSGWTIVENTSKTECSALNPKKEKSFSCYQCNSNGDIYLWSDSMPTSGACGGGFHTVDRTEENCHS